MSVCAVYKTDNKVKIIADSRCSFRTGKFTELTNEKKFFEIENNPGCFITLTGIVSTIKEVVNYCSFINLSAYKPEDFVRKFIPGLCKYLVEKNIKIFNNDELDIQCSIILIVKDVVYYIYSCGYVEIIEDFCVIGSGAEMAKNYITINKNKYLNKDELMIDGFRHSIKYTKYVGYPIHILDTSTNQITSLNK